MAKRARKGGKYYHREASNPPRLPEARVFLPSTLLSLMRILMPCLVMPHCPDHLIINENLHILTMLP